MSLYFIAFLFSPEVEEMLWEMKRELSEKTGAVHALKIPPHITLFPPFHWESDRLPEIENLCRKLQNKCDSFEGKFTQYGNFRKDVIFLQPELPGMVHDFQTQLEASFLTLLPELKKTIYPPWKPHTTLVFRDLKDECFDQVFPQLSNVSMNIPFFIQGFFVLEHQQKLWKPLRYYPFTSQTEFP
jgi:2'-5' RNA ligase